MHHQSHRAIIQFLLFFQSILVLFCHTSIFITLSDLGILTWWYRWSTWLWTVFIIFSGTYYIWKKIQLWIYIYAFYLIDVGVAIATYDIYVAPTFWIKTISCFILLGLSILILSSFFLQKYQQNTKD